MSSKKVRRPFNETMREQALVTTIAESDSGEVTLGTIPAGCPVRAAFSKCETVEGGSGWDIYVGDDTDKDGLLHDAYVTKDTANAVGGVTPATVGDRLTDGTALKQWAPTSDTTLKAYVTAGSAATGRVQISVHYVKLP